MSYIEKMKPHSVPEAQTVLVGDDDELTQELLREMFDDLGFIKVQSAMDGRQALKILADQHPPPQFLVCDIFMPEMDGFEFLEKLAILHFKGSLVMMTGGDPEMLRIARDIAVSNRLNVVGCFLKPVAMEQMASAIAAQST